MAPSLRALLPGAPGEKPSDGRPLVPVFFLHALEPRVLFFRPRDVFRPRGRVARSGVVQPGCAGACHLQKRTNDDVFLLNTKKRALFGRSVVQPRRPPEEENDDENTTVVVVTTKLRRKKDHQKPRVVENEEKKGENVTRFLPLGQTKIFLSTF